MTTGVERLPEEYRADVEHAVRILKEGGCREVYVFGSVAEGMAGVRSDIDLAVRGCPPEKFFPLLGKLMVELEHPVELVDLDTAARMAGFLEREGELLHVG